MCRPADLPLILNIHTWLIIYYIYRCRSMFNPRPVMSICRPAHPEYTYRANQIYTCIRYVIGHAGLLSSRVIVKARYGVCILFWWSGGLAPQASYYDKSIT